MSSRSSGGVAGTRPYFWWGEAPEQPSSVRNAEDVSDSWVIYTDRRAEPLTPDVPSPKYGAAVQINDGASG